MTSFGVPTAIRKTPTHRRSIHSHHPHPSLAKAGRTASVRRAAMPASCSPPSAQSAGGRHVRGLSAELACPLHSLSTPLRVLACPAGTHIKVHLYHGAGALHTSQRDAYRAVLIHVNAFYVCMVFCPPRPTPSAVDLLPAPVSLPPDAAARPWTMHAWTDNS